MGHVTDTLGNHDTPVSIHDNGHGHNRLYRALAWVGIAAGSVFIVATVFFSGYVLGQHNGGGFHHGPHRGMLKPFPGPDGGPMGPGGPMMGPGGPAGPDEGPRAAPPAPPTPQPGTPPRP
jgi:hypothetical protein